MSRTPCAPAVSSSPHANRRRWRPRLEVLETRDLPSAQAYPTLLLAHPSGGASPLGTAGATGTTPTQIRHAYGIDQLSANGAGTTIAIVDAYDDPKIANDLHQFDVNFGLSDPTFTKVNQSGGSTLPAANGGWSQEIALDVEWAHAIAPGASILLVEANDNSLSNLFAGVQYAASHANVVSMSWGGGEFSGENTYDTTFLTAGVTFIASSGDSGSPVIYPAASPNVLAVGGTTTHMDTSGNITSESGWSGSGGGISGYEIQPVYQVGVVTQTTTQRANPDVAYDADPNTGFPVYDTENNPVSAPWSQFGGTSDAAPQWAGLVALADQARIQASLPSLTGVTDTLPLLYKAPAADFHDITTGGSTGSPPYAAGPGYDLVTGRGTPQANLLVPYLAQSPVSATHFVVTVPTTPVTAGSSFPVTVQAEDASNHLVTSYNGPVQLTNNGQSLLPAGSTLSGGTGTFSNVILTTAGSQTLTAAASGVNSGSANVTVTAASADHLVFGQQPTNVTVNTAITPAVTVKVVDKYGNVLSGDNTDTVSLVLGNNPGSATLTGGAAVTVNNGVATFPALSLNAAGTGYTLKATSGTLPAATSSSFNVSAASASNLVEGFETTTTWYVAAGSVSAVRATYAAHDGTYGLDQMNNSGWLYRTDSAVQVKQGDTLSVWLKFAGSANGRAYFGFGASSAGTLSLVAAPNSNQLILQSNLGWGFTDLASVSQHYQANHWYRLEVDWSPGGKIVGRLFDSNGTTQLNQVTATTSVITAGGIAFRATGNDKYWDTVTAQYGVNPAVVSGSGTSGGHLTMQDLLALLWTEMANGANLGLPPWMVQNR